MCILTFSINFARNISHSKKNCDRYDTKWTSYEVPVILVRF